MVPSSSADNVTSHVAWMCAWRIKILEKPPGLSTWTKIRVVGLGISGLSWDFRNWEWSKNNLRVITLWLRPYGKLTHLPFMLSCLLVLFQSQRLFLVLLIILYQPFTDNQLRKMSRYLRSFSWYGGSSLNGYSRKRTALLTTAFTKPGLNSDTNSLFIHLRKWPWTLGGLTI